MAATQPISMKDVLSLLGERGAGNLAHGPQRTLSDHLRGTMKVLLHWQQPQDVVAAGLLHSIYATDIYHQQLVPFSERSRVRQIAGTSAERLVRLFGTIRRDSFFQNLSRLQGEPWVDIHVECHRGPDAAKISREDAGKLLVIYMANAAEQTRKTGGGPGVWVSVVSRWGEWARPLAKRVPPVFESCSKRVSAEDEQLAGESYRTGLQKLSENMRAARLQFSAAMKHLPWVAEPRILLSFAALLDGRWPDAFQHATNALLRLRHWGTAWDKRVEFGEWESIVNGIILCSETGFVDPVKAEGMISETARRACAEWSERLKSLALSRLTPPDQPKPAARTGKTPPASALPPRFVSYITGFGREDAKPKHNFYPGLRKEPAHSATQFALARALAASYAEIRDEFRRIQPHDGFQNEIERIDRTGNWTIFPLYELGRRNDENCSKCPLTASIVEQYGATHSITSAVYFSILAPGTHVAAHTGPTNMRLRCHLGIEVPEGCRLRVGDKWLTWREGECLIFDDSFSHEVWNDSDRRRVVLIVDVWHPDLTREELSLLEGLNRFALAHASAMSSYWKKNEQARKDSLIRALAETHPAKQPLAPQSDPLELPAG